MTFSFFAYSSSSSFLFFATAKIKQEQSTFRGIYHFYSVLRPLESTILKDLGDPAYALPPSLHFDFSIFPLPHSVFLFILEYFSQHLGAYESVLSALEDLNVTILKAMDTTKKVGFLVLFFQLYDVMGAWIA